MVKMFHLSSCSSCFFVFLHLQQTNQCVYVYNCFNSPHLCVCDSVLAVKVNHTYIVRSFLLLLLFHFLCLCMYLCLRRKCFSECKFQAMVFQEFYQKVKMKGICSYKPFVRLLGKYCKSTDASPSTSSSIWYAQSAEHVNYTFNETIMAFWTMEKICQKHNYMHISILCYTLLFNLFRHACVCVHMHSYVHSKDGKLFYEHLVHLSFYGYL